MVRWWEAALIVLFLLGGTITVWLLLDRWERHDD